MTETKVRVFNLGFLSSFCEKNKVVLTKKIDGKITRNTRIEGKCITEFCEGNFDKSFVCLVDNGAYCRKCTLKLGMEKRIKTNLEKYGTEHPSQSKSVREKTEQTNLRKRGVKHNMQADSVKEKFKKTNLEKYGVAHHSSSEKVKKKRNATILKKKAENPMWVKEILQKRITTNLEKRGVENPMQAEDIKAKIRETNLRKRGVENPGQAEDIKAKIRETNLRKRGVENSLMSDDVRQKIKATNNERYGADNPFGSEDIQAKIKETNLRIRGVEYPMQDPEVLAKMLESSFSLIPYTLPSGDICMIQGYEHFALDTLVKEYEEEDIVTGAENVPVIQYITDDGKFHTHTPDIYLKSVNILIEVKSVYTLDLHREKNLLKQKAAAEAGYQYEIWVFDPKGNKVEEYIKFPIVNNV